MAAIEWDTSYSVGNEEIDEQHKKWIAIYNRIDAAMSGTDTANLSAITADSLTAMYEYAREHFRFEEQYMEQLHYPHLIEHRRKHRDFENKIYRDMRGIKAGTVILNTTLLKVIKNWLVDHILHEDKKYHAFTRQRDAASG
jgi:hemerythrin-like metal-binding protein